MGGSFGCRVAFYRDGPGISTDVHHHSFRGGAGQAVLLRYICRRGDRGCIAFAGPGREGEYSHAKLVTVKGGHYLILAVLYHPFHIDGFTKFIDCLERDICREVFDKTASFRQELEIDLV